MRRYSGCDGVMTNAGWLQTFLKYWRACQEIWQMYSRLAWLQHSKVQKVNSINGGVRYWLLGGPWAIGVHVLNQENYCLAMQCGKIMRSSVFLQRDSIMLENAAIHCAMMISKILNLHPKWLTDFLLPYFSKLLGGTAPLAPYNHPLEQYRNKNRIDNNLEDMRWSVPLFFLLSIFCHV